MGLRNSTQLGAQASGSICSLLGRHTCSPLHSFPVGICGWSWKLTVIYNLTSVEKVNSGCEKSDLSVNPFYYLAVVLTGVRACGSCQKNQSANHIGCLIIFTSAQPPWASQITA